MAFSSDIWRMGFQNWNPSCFQKPPFSNAEESSSYKQYPKDKASLNPREKVTQVKQSKAKQATLIQQRVNSNPRSKSYLQNSDCLPSQQLNGVWLLLLPVSKIKNSFPNYKECVIFTLLEHQPGQEYCIQEKLHVRLSRAHWSWCIFLQIHSPILLQRQTTQ